MADIPPDPNILEANDRQALADGAQDVSEVEDRLNVLRNEEPRGKCDIKSSEAEDSEARHVAEMREKSLEVARANERVAGLETDNLGLSTELALAREQVNQLQARLEKAEGSISSKSLDSIRQKATHDKLKQSHHELKEEYEKLVTKNEELKTKTKELKTKNEELKKNHKAAQATIGSYRYRHSKTQLDLNCANFLYEELVKIQQNNEEKVSSCTAYIADWRENNKTTNDKQCEAVVSAIMSHLVGFRSWPASSRDPQPASSSFGPDAYTTHRWDHLISAVSRSFHNPSFDVRLLEEEHDWPDYEAIFVSIVQMLSLDEYVPRFEAFLEYSQPGSTYCL